jgi:hypothetical protein
MSVCESLAQASRRYITYSRRPFVFLVFHMKVFDVVIFMLCRLGPRRPLIVNFYPYGVGQRA